MSNAVLYGGLVLIWGLYALIGRRYTSVIPTVPFVPFGLLVVGFPLNLWLPWLGTVVVAVLHVPIGVLVLREFGQEGGNSSPSDREDHRS